MIEDIEKRIGERQRELQQARAQFVQWQTRVLQLEGAIIELQNQLESLKKTSEAPPTEVTGSRKESS